MTPKPAQSDAPSAAEFQDTWKCPLDHAVIAEGDACDVAMLEAYAALRTAQLQTQLDLLKGQMNAGWESEKSDCSKALFAMCAAKKVTPAETYGSNSGWAISDLCRALREEHVALSEARERTQQLEAKLNTPEINDFRDAVVVEAVHQRERWGADHDLEKADEDWFWTLGYLAGKALNSAKAGDSEKLRHHQITSAALLANWHRATVEKAVRRLTSSASAKGE